MIPIKSGKRRYSLLIGRITEFYSATIKKLALIQKRGFAQIAPASKIAGVRHICAALEHAISAGENGSAFTKNLELEFLVRLFGEKQLNAALSKAEFGDEDVALLIESGAGAKATKKIVEIKKALNFEEIKGIKASALGKNKKELMEFYKIGETELATLSDLDDALEELVIERISFVALER